MDLLEWEGGLDILHGIWPVHLLFGLWEILIVGGVGGSQGLASGSWLADPLENSRVVLGAT
jgi:hypothetical protein